MILCDLVIGCCILSIPVSGSFMPLLTISLAVFGLFYGGFFALYAASGPDYFPQATGTVLGLWSTLHSVGMIVGTPIFGLIADLAGSFHHSFYLAALFGIVAALLLIPLRKSFERVGSNMLAGTKVWTRT